MSAMVRERKTHRAENASPVSIAVDPPASRACLASINAIHDKSADVSRLARLIFLALRACKDGDTAICQADIEAMEDQAWRLSDLANELDRMLVDLDAAPKPAFGAQPSPSVDRPRVPIVNQDAIEEAYRAALALQMALRGLEAFSQSMSPDPDDFEALHTLVATCVRHCASAARGTA